jgi:two-component system LytT family sensor kinase
MKPQYKKILFYIIRNLLLYAFFAAMNYMVYSMDSKRSREGYIINFLFITVFYVWAMIHNSLLLDKLLLKRKYWWYLFSFVLVFGAMVFLHHLIIHPEKSMGSRVGAIIIQDIVYSCFALTFYLAFKYVMERKAFYQVKIMQRDVELQQLKAHLNPHFLFNALNNIYSYTLQHNRYGNELILKLAELMRFILDNADKNQIRLEDELNFVTNYIVFERERLGERCQIHFTQVGQIGERQITPLILFPFIENACKYGADTIQKTEIDISIENEPGFLKLIVKNNVVNKTPPSTKTGLQKAIRRLELLYPDKHEVLITTDEAKFSVELILQYHEG